jgi:hypothetical protein
MVESHGMSEKLLDGFELIKKFFSPGCAYQSIRIVRSDKLDFKMESLIWIGLSQIIEFNVVGYSRWRFIGLSRWLNHQKLLS